MTAPENDEEALENALLALEIIKAGFNQHDKKMLHYAEDYVEALGDKMDTAVVTALAYHLGLQATEEGTTAAQLIEHTQTHLRATIDKERNPNTR